MVKYCSAFNCYGSFILGSNVSFHKIPKNEQLRKIWLKNMGRENLAHKDHLTLCSRHFRDDDFERRFPTSILKPNAVPTIFNMPKQDRKKKVPNMKPEKENLKSLTHQTQQVAETQPQLVVLLDNNYGLSNNKGTVKMFDDNISITNTPINVSNGNTKYTELNNQIPISDTNAFQIVYSSSDENFSSESLAKMINTNASKILSVQPQTLPSKRCRGCLKSNSSETYKKVTSPCYMNKTIKDAINQVVPEIELPIQETDLICGKCFDTLKDSLEFAVIFKSSENSLKKEVTPKDPFDDAISLLNIPQRYTPLRDNINLEVADKVISLSKIDNNNLTKFIDSLQTNQVNIFQYETNPFSRKRVLLLGNPKLRRCYVCYAKFVSESQLEDHLDTEHQITKEYLVKPIRHMTALEEEPLTCRACNRTFLSEFNLKSHLKWCISFPCPHCKGGKTFASDKLVEHTELVHGDKFPFKCCKCKTEFDEYKKYIQHNCEGHTCNTCGRKFQSAVAITYHYKKHKNVPCNMPFKNCPICKQIVKEDNYSTHLLDHKKFICSKCGMRFAKSEILESHEKTHVRGPKTHKCNTCGKLFYKADTLLKHQEIHQLSATEITCEICSEQFDGMKSLKQHIMNDHGDPNVICELCGKECRPDRLRQHIEMKHSSNPKKCPLCSKSFVQLIHYKKHMEVHTNEKHYPRTHIRKSAEESDAIEEKDIQEMEVEELNANTEESVTNLGIGHATEEVNVEKIDRKRKKNFNFGVNISNGQMVCKYCLKSFSSQKSLWLHIQSHYQAKRSEKCSYCNLTFFNKAYRLKHERCHTVISMNKFRCSACWRVLQNQEELNYHKKLHSNIS